MSKLKLNKTFSSLALCLTVALLLLCMAAVGQEPKQNGHVGKEQSWTANYNNDQYGYALKIPSGFIGVSPPAPWPQHGIEIRLTPNRDAYIVTNAFLSAVDYPSLDAAVDAALKDAEQKHGDLQIVSRQAEQLGTLPAIRVVTRYKQAGSGISVMNETITAIRKARRPEDGVLYTITLVTAEQRYVNDAKLFTSVVRSWRLKPLPR
ncbi:MAG TPA: hypothetical protein VGJ37_18605 [Pyrinomonadaceae bacterium]|jgi:hypothetical protein